MSEMKNLSQLNRLALGIVAASFAFSLPAVAEENTQLGESMEQSGKALKSLRSIKKDDWAAGAEAARTAADGIRKGMAFEPVIFKDMKDAHKKMAKFPHVSSFFLS